MKKISLFSFFLLIHVLCFSQSISNYTASSRKFIDQLPAKYLLNIDSLRDEILKTMPIEYKNEKRQRYLYEFADQQAFYSAEGLQNGYVYSDWQEMEDYVNEILKKVIPDSLTELEKVHVYLVKDPHFNAGVGAAGQIELNVGVFSNINDEATLASILCHEVAHFYLAHVVKSFLKIDSDEFGIGLLGLDEEKYKNYVIGLEVQADSLGMVWLSKSNYSFSGFVDAFKLMDRIDRKRLKEFERQFTTPRYTHPLANERGAYLKEIYLKYQTPERKKFLVDEKKFYRLKDEAKPEILNASLKGLNYQKCIEDAFKFHLNDPDNEIYIYYLMEGIRRLCYFEKKKWSANFVTSEYFEDISADGRQVKINKRQHIFQELDGVLLEMSSFDISNMKAKFYWEGEPRFKTNEQAFEYFNKLAEAIKCKECKLSYALSYCNDPTNFRPLLIEYLSQDGIKKSEFANQILDNTLYKNLPHKKLTIINNMNVGVKQGEQTIPVRMKINHQKNEMQFLCDTLNKVFPERIFLLNSILKRFKTNEFLRLDELNDFAEYIYSKTKGFKLHYVDPDFLDLFYKYNVDEIEFTNIYYEEFRKGEKTLESLEEITRLDYQTILEQSKRTRLIGARTVSAIASVGLYMNRKVSRGAMDIDFKKNGAAALISEMRGHYKYKDADDSGYFEEPEIKKY